MSKKNGIIVIIVISIVFFATCIRHNKKEVVIANNTGELFAGSAKCETCHYKIYESFLKTAHFYTSQTASKKTVLGSFEKGENVFSYSYYEKVAMENRDSGLYQVEYDQNFREKQSHRFDIIIGSGTRGQSYLSWKNKRLVQLPVSFFTLAGTWANSPGFADYQPLFNRIISERCLECHSTYFKALSSKNTPTPEFDRNQVLYGVQCETCHGPANDHVVYHQQNPASAKGALIKNPISFTRRQQLDLCGLCHGGLRQSTKTAFNFYPGDTLADLFKPDTATLSSQNVEVHDNQYGLLTRSKCFQTSKTMTCNTCHNPHRQERGELALFSARCMNCHNDSNVKFCKMAPFPGNQIKQNCIDCHMPEKQSKMLDVKLEGKSNNVPSILRTHFIAIYRGETKKYLPFKK